MNQTVYDIAILFFVYSFLAWLAETTVATLKEKDFKNRGFASGPFCFIYGFTGTLLTVVLQDRSGITAVYPLIWAEELTCYIVSFGESPRWYGSRACILTSRG